MINLPLYASTPICAEGLVRARGREGGSGSYHDGRRAGPPKRVPIIIKPGAPEGDDEDTEAAGHTRLGWKKGVVVDTQEKSYGTGGCGG